MACFHMLFLEDVKIYNSSLDCTRSRLRTIRHAKLAQKIVDLRLDSCFGNIEDATDFPVEPAVHYMFKNFSLPFR